MADKENMDAGKPVTIYDIKVEDHPEFGNVFIFTCPKCHQELRILEYYHDKDMHMCSCGYYWTVNLSATGEKEEDIWNEPQK